MRVVAVLVKRLRVICHTDLTSCVILHYVSYARKTATVNDGFPFGSSDIQTVFVSRYEASRERHTVEYSHCIIVFTCVCVCAARENVNITIMTHFTDGFRVTA